MPYLTEAQFIQRFDQVERDQLLEQLDASDATAKIEGAIADAEAEVNSYLSVRYATPVESTNQVKRLVANIARFLLQDNMATAESRERYEDTIKLLKTIAARKANLQGGGEDTTIDVSSEDNAVRVSTGATAMDLTGY